MKIRRGRKRNKERYDKILFMRFQGLPITEIGKKLGMSRQGVWYYLKKYGDIDEATNDGGLERKEKVN